MAKSKALDAIIASMEASVASGQSAGGNFIVDDMKAIEIVIKAVTGTGCCYSIANGERFTMLTVTSGSQEALQRFVARLNRLRATGTRFA